jgi:uncharacterized protein (TIGR02453 family)
VPASQPSGRRAERSAAPARFEGFADVGARFFHALKKHQSRDWFAAHRHEYEEGWVVPMKRLLAEVRERIDPLFVQHALGEPKIFRIHRDVRFSKDKSPYKTNIAGYVPLAQSGRGPSQPIPLYLQLGTETFVGAGHYMMEPEQLVRYREAVLDDRRGRDLARILATATRAGLTIGSFEMLKKVPRGVDAAHPRADLLKRKGLTLHVPALPKNLVTSRALVPWLVKQADRARPLVEWLADVTG